MPIQINSKRQLRSRDPVGIAIFLPSPLDDFLNEAFLCQCDCVVGTVSHELDAQKVGECAFSDEFESATLELEEH